MPVMKLFRNRIILLVIIILFLAGLTSLSIYLKKVSDYKQAVREIIFHEIDISHISDGVYIGECDVKFIYAKVEVTVQSGEITRIDILKHKNGRGKSAETIINKIVDEQRIDVDTTSGATNSSIVIKKAVENALKSG